MIYYILPFRYKIFYMFYRFFIKNSYICKREYIS